MGTFPMLSSTYFLCVMLMTRGGHFRLCLDTCLQKDFWSLPIKSLARESAFVVDSCLLHIRRIDLDIFISSYSVPCLALPEMIQRLKASLASARADLTRSFHPGIAWRPDPLLISLVGIMPSAALCKLLRPTMLPYNFLILCLWLGSEHAVFVQDIASQSKLTSLLNNVSQFEA